MPENVNIRQVAKAAGVSVATVSGILNHSSRHSPATAARIRGIMQEMGYVPRRNRLRREAEENNSSLQRVGMLFPDAHEKGTQTPLGLALFEGVQKALAEQNIQVSVHTLNEDNSLPDTILKGQLDGLVVRSGSNTEDGDAGIYRQLEDIGIPMVWAFGSSSMAQMVDAVRMDDRGCGILAANKVNAKNSGRIFIIKPSGRPNLDIEIRVLAFSIHLLDLGITEEPIVLETEAALSAIKGLRAKAPITIFIAGHDSDVIETHETVIPTATNKGIPVSLIAVMTGETALKPHKNEDVQILQIDPYRVGVAAGRQLLSRHQSPWADPTKLLVPAKETTHTPPKKRQVKKRKTNKA